MNRDLENILQRATAARRAGGLDVARQAFQQALETSQLAADEHGRFVALRGLAQVQRDEGKPAEAIGYYEEALGLAHELGNPELVAHSLRHLADACAESGLDQRAAPLYAEAIGMYRVHDGATALDFANALRPAAALCERAGDLEQAAAHWQEARDLYEQAGVEAGVAECREGLARCQDPAS